MERLTRWFGPQGRLSKAIPGFVSRPQQTEMAEAIQQAIIDKSPLVVEAGTGTGKTFAYLVPVLLSGEKAIISTATKTLQDQLYQKDLPLLKKALGVSTRVFNLKGRANYICRMRTEQHAEEGTMATKLLAEEVVKVFETIPKLQTGERGELPFIAENSEVWPLVTSTADNCLGQACDAFEDCFLMKARRQALKADVVVINHHVFFADSVLKDEGFGELLPGVGCVVFDEAHQLPEIIEQFHAERFSTKSCAQWMNDLIDAWPTLDLPNQPLMQYYRELQQLVDKWLMLKPHHEDRVDFHAQMRQPAFSQVFESICEWFGILNQFLALNLPENSSEITLIAQRFRDMGAVLQSCQEKDAGMMVWIEYHKQSIVLHRTPFKVASIFKNIMDIHHAAYVFTSATLTIANNFENFTTALGLGRAKTLMLASPFDYGLQTMLYLPRGMPDPNADDYYDTFIFKIMPIIEACRGRTFILFTSHRALQLVALKLKQLTTHPLFVQGEESKTILLARFREHGNAILLGTSTFWEGVDVKGQALSCVIIDKIPFQSPGDPLIRGRMRYYESLGLSGFDVYMLPQAIMALKQGVGRLIRDADDKGVLMLADPRLLARDYAAMIYNSLPPVTITRELKNVLGFIESWECNEAIISD